MKIQFPNPDNYTNDIMGFLDQLELCIHHARKSAEKILSKYSEEDLKNGNNTPWIGFNLGLLERNDKLKQAVEEIDGDLFIEQDIELEIFEL